MIYALARLLVALAVSMPYPPPGPPPTYPPAPPTLPPIVVMAVGDSLTVGHGPGGTITESYRPELSRLMNLTGQPHTWVVAARGGSKCSEWAAQIDGLITTYDPHIIFLDCGTNDTPDDATEGDVDAMLSIAQARGVRVVVARIGQPDMESQTNIIRPYIWDWMHNTSLAIARAAAAHPEAAAADMVRVPANIEWLQSDGIHLTGRSEAAYAQIFYRAAQSIMPGWRTLDQMRAWEMCGLSGHWRGDPWPTPDVAYRVCRS